MKGNAGRRALRLGSRALLLLLALAGARQAGAQTTTASIRGTVIDESGNPVAGAKVVAVSSDTGFEHPAVSQNDGFYSLNLPPGNYEIRASLAGHTPVTRAVRVEVGQTLNLGLQLATAVEESITVSAAPMQETRTSEVATNVTQEQIQLLPQDDRNFLNFALLAPGMHLSTDPFNKQVSAGAQDASQINVFIDGASYKNDVLEGGVVGQNSSRGNPFPQNAVQEFRVITSNYKAEYELASSAIITAVTKTGGNAWHGDAFGELQNKNLVTEDQFAQNSGQPAPTYSRGQEGISVGGPIIKDKLHLFLSYEGDQEKRDNTVTLGDVNNAPPQLLQYQGTFTSPFRSNLGFGKLSLQATESQTLELSGNLRKETDVRDFGGQTSFQAADNVKQNVDTVLLRHVVTATRWLNEASVTGQRSQWNPVAIFPNLIGQSFDGIVRIGGKDTSQDFVQDRIGVRDDLSTMGSWHGDHVAKGGVTLAFLNYKVTKSLFGNPLFSYNGNLGPDVPYQAQYGVGNPQVSARNDEIGGYLQDDWNPIARLSLNLGLRWDYETNQLDDKYVTPTDVSSQLSSFVPAQYFTNGHQRSPYYGEVQPRLGGSYDLLGTGKTVLFAGVGRYYDRDLFNNLLDEKYRLQYNVRTFFFSTDGLPRNGIPTIVWQPQYLSAAGLNTLIAEGLAPKQDVFLVDNNTKPPYSDQASAGVRQAFGRTLISLSYTAVRGYNGFTYIFGNRNPDGSCCVPLAGFNNVLLSSANKRSWYDGLFLTIDRPFTVAGKWGYSIAYTLGKAERTGNDLFSLDFPTVDDYPRHPTPNDQRNTLVMTGIFALPYGVIGSTIINLGSGVPYDVVDASQGFGVNQIDIDLGGGRPTEYDFLIGKWAYRSVDLRLQKDFQVPRGLQRVSFMLEGFNIFDFKNYGCYDGFIAPTSGAPNAHFGQPGCLLDTGARLQLGMSLAF